MKKVILFLALLTCPLLAVAQKGISYQAIILDPNPIKIPGQDITGQPFVNGAVSLKFRIYSANLIQEFEEVHTTQTDAYGMVNVMIGSQNPSAFSSLVWDSKQKSLHVLVSFDQGGTYTKVSEQQLTYNPMALFAETASKLSETLSIAGGGTGATTAAAARTNLGLGNVDNTSDAAKPISSATQAALDTKANENEVTTALATKANANEVTTALATKANAAEVTSSLNLKASANEVNTALASKANADEVTTALATKANANEVNTALATKANAAEVTSVLATKANAEEVNTALATKANAAEVTSALATKANASDVSASLALKEDVSNKANTALGSSTTLYPTQNAVKTYVDAQIASATLPDANSITKGKIQLAGDLGGTAAAPTVPGLELKANTNDVNTALALKAPIASPSFTGTVGVGTSNPSSSSVLEISSTTKGILIPRMTNTERSAVANPVNALLVFNTTNNRFEVYKTTCSCWIAISDGGSGIVVPPVNTIPTLNNMNYKGLFRVGGTGNVFYTYADSDGDAEAATTIHWEIANDNNGAAKTLYSTSASPTFTAADAGKYVRTKITPRAAKGLLNGIEYYGSWTLIDAAVKPYATNVNISGKAEQGSTLTGAYTFNGGTNGVTTYTENTLGSTYQWQTASNNKGVGISNMAYPDGGTAFGKTIKPTINDVNKYIRFGVLAKDNEPTPNSSSNYVYSDWVGPITLAAETAPIAKDVSFSPAPGTLITTKAKYTYEDANNDPEGASTYQWYFATNASGAGQTAISGATTLELLLTNEYAEKYIGFGITPKALTGNLTGTEVVYYAPTASIPGADFTIESATQNANNFYINRVMSASDYITVGINVTTAGSIKFTTNTANGYSFSADGVYSIGLHDVTLVAKGTQLAYNGTGDNFTITGIGATTNTTTIDINNVRFGNQLTSHFNGIVGGVHNTTNGNDDTYYLNTSYSTGETFHINSTCLTKPISTSACVGTTITVGSNTYSITTINGQCWMTQNLKELPGGVAVNATQWLATSSGDLGYYGYYNISNTSGTAGWSISENTANEGLLYQWSAAMMGATNERAKGICPTGWHIPSDCEFMYLEHGLGMALNEQSKEGTRSDKIDSQGTPGHKLRSVSVGTGSTNISGFSAIGVGARNPQNGPFDYKTNGYFWTSSQSTTTTAFGRGSVGGSSGVLRLGYTKNWAFNVRCLKD